MCSLTHGGAVSPSRPLRVAEGNIRWRVHRWAAPRRVVGVVFLAGLFWASGARAILNPHDETLPNRCLSCHTKAITAEDARRGDLFLLKDSIDGVCLICHHKEECCTVGQKHSAIPGSLGISHPSDISARSISPASRPKTLPLQDGRITCSTCHLHDRQKPNDYNLVRMVVIKNDGINWTGLCHDCHDKY